MQIIKDKQLIDNVWVFAEDDSAAINDQDNITVSVEHWKNQAQQLLNRTGKTGLRIKPTDKVEDLAGMLQGIELIELDFPAFADGRLFSHARLLRSRLGYQGEIRAVGNYLPEQVFYLHRVGVNAFLPLEVNQVPLILSSLDDFTVKYQASSI